MAPTTFTLPADVRDLLDAPNYVHLSTLRRDGTPRNWVVWVGLEGDRVLVCTTECSWKAKDLRRDPRVGLSVVDGRGPDRVCLVIAIDTARARTLGFRHDLAQTPGA
jgi:PPOX class probable F420-dependent enzyme